MNIRSVQHKVWIIFINNFKEIIQITAPLIVFSFLWSAFIGERTTNEIESYILNVYFCTCASIALVTVYKKEFLAEHKYSLIDILMCKSFITTFIYLNSFKLFESLFLYANYLSPIQGFDEFYKYAYIAVAVYFITSYHGLVYLSSTFKEISKNNIKEVFRGKLIELVVLIIINTLLIGAVLMILIIAFSRFLPEYMGHPLFVFVNWILPVSMGLLIGACGCVVIKKETQTLT